VSSGPCIWAGGTRDAAGLVDRRLRDYDPSLATFISEDPSGVNGGFNLYAYVQGDPLNRVDPTGLSFLSGALDLAGDFSVGVANGATFGAFGAVTGLHACGVAGTIGAWAGSGLLAWGTGGLATAGLAAAGRVGAQALIGGGAIGGMVGSVSSSVATGQSPNVWSVSVGALFGAMPGGIHAYGAGPQAGNFIDTWRVTPLMPGAVMAADEINTLYGPGSGGGRKC
jgi:RHS repeat-associated protein